MGKCSGGISDSGGGVWRREVLPGYMEESGEDGTAGTLCGIGLSVDRGWILMEVVGLGVTLGCGFALNSVSRAEVCVSTKARLSDVARQCCRGRLKGDRWQACVKFR
jgi:hypothetical protein